MKTLRFFFVALSASVLLVSCSGSRVDSHQPTVSQQDAYDLSWGLQPRKARGNPKMRYQYNARAEQAAASVSPEPQAAAAAPALAPAPGRAVPSRAEIPPALR